MTRLAAPPTFQERKLRSLPRRTSSTPTSLDSSNTTGRLVGMGIDWENILDASGNGLDDAYDSAVSAVIYSDDPVEDRRPLPVGEEHDDTDGLR
ncbi:hypothetical protein ACFQ0M_43285 [Kitasatospora aburaviensis]